MRNKETQEMFENIIITVIAIVFVMMILYFLHEPASVGARWIGPPEIEHLTYLPSIF